MAPTSLMLPVFVQVLLTFAILIALGRARSKSLSESRTDRGNPDVALARFSWSDAATKVSNNFSNQFEMPVLFYAGVAFALLLKQSDVVLVALAWGFVLTRVLHAIVHTTSNAVSVRFPLYLLGVVCLLAFWIVLMVRVFDGAAVV